MRIEENEPNDSSMLYVYVTVQTNRKKEKKVVNDCFLLLCAEQTVFSLVTFFVLSFLSSKYI